MRRLFEVACGGKASYHDPHQLHANRSRARVHHAAGFPGAPQQASRQQRMNTPKRRLAGFAGYLIDLFRLARGIPVNQHSAMKYLAIRSLGKRVGAKFLIETGTFRGVTAARCARAFEKVLTVELDAVLAAEAAQRLAKYANIKVYRGDAVALLPQMLAQCNEGKAVVFLDAHFSGGGTARGDVPEPALAELGILAGHADRIGGIIIDDFRSFGAEEGFPAKAELLAAAERHFPPPKFAIKAHCDQIIIERAQD
jgi:hypothetical protein